MKNNSKITKYLFLFFIFNLKNISCQKFPQEVDILSYRKNDELKPLVFISKDTICENYTISILNPISVIQFGYNYQNIISQHYSISWTNPVMDKITVTVFYGDKIYNNNTIIFLGMISGDKKGCYFGLSPELPPSVELKEGNNTLEYMKSTKQIDKKIFSLDKWDLNSDLNVIKSKLYLGYNHKDFNSDKKYIGICDNVNKTLWGCNFNEMIFNNVTIPLNSSEDGKKFYTIFFSSEDYKIRFPKKFQSIFKEISKEACDYRQALKKTICKDFFKTDLFIPLKLRNENMDITLEIDSEKRFNSDDSINQDLINMMFTGDDIIFPLIMLKNFHIQFDGEKNVIRFYSKDKNLLNVKLKEEPKEEEGSSVGLIIFLVILIILIIGGLGYGAFYFIKKRKSSIDINRFSKYEDEDDFKNMNDKKVF